MTMAGYSTPTAECEAQHPRPELKGVDGWLAWRIFGYMVILPIMCLLEIFKSPTAPVVLIELVIGYYFFYTGLLLWKLKAKGVKLAKIGEGTCIVLGLLLLMVDPKLGVQMAVGGVIWLSYFQKSKRVQNTYFSGPQTVYSGTVIEKA